MGRAGTFQRTREGNRVFLPKDLPPSDPPLELSDHLLEELSDADQAIGRLDGAAAVLPEPDMFVYSYVRKEAVLSSQIEGTRSSLTDLFDAEAGARTPGQPRDVREVANFVVAMGDAIKQVQNGQKISLELIRGAHRTLFRGVRGGGLEPGEFRRIQNWIGHKGSTPATAEFIPPPPEQVQSALTALERYVQVTGAEPSLIRASLAHAQFETIHPFVDGNGRIGRLLVTLMLIEAGSINRPVLYLSNYFLRNRDDYIRYLQRIGTDGDWEGWVRFFLRGVKETSEQAFATAKALLALRDQHEALLQRTLGRRTSLAIALLESLSKNPVISITGAAKSLGVTFPTASLVITEMKKQGLLAELTGQRSFRYFRYEPFVDIIGRDAAVPNRAS